jgi:hypothetical protein
VVCPGEIKRRNPTMRAAIPLIKTSHHGHPECDEVATLVVIIFSFLLKQIFLLAKSFTINLSYTLDATQTPKIRQNFLAFF